MNEIVSFLVNAFLFYLAFKAGQISVYFQHGKQQVLKHDAETIINSGIKPVITVEEINGIYYAYDGNDFLAQGSTPDDLGKKIATRFPNKYRVAQIKIKA